MKGLLAVVVPLRFVSTNDWLCQYSIGPFKTGKVEFYAPMKLRDRIFIADQIGKGAIKECHPMYLFDRIWAKQAVKNRNFCLL